MSSSVPIRDLNYCAITYTLPQLEIVKPRMALCLGAKTFNSVRTALGLEPLTLQDACIPSAPTRVDATELYGFPTPAVGGRRMREDYKRSR